MEDFVYLVDDSRIISEVLDGETVIIDFKNGSYYSLNHTGSVVWEKILKGHTESQILSYMAERFVAPSETVEQSTRFLLSQLLELSLLSRQESPPAPALESYIGEKQEFFVPTLQQFQDMQEMLLADPIHDVDETGWPTLRK